MEYLAIGLLAMVGRELSKNSINDRKVLTAPKQLSNPNKIIKNGTTINTNSLTNPAIKKSLTKVHHYYRSAKSQNTSDSVKDLRVQQFTGTDDVIYKPKKEVKNMFHFKHNKQNIYGSQPDNEETRLDVYKNSLTGIQNNVGPVKKKLIGPGLNTKDASKGGYHQYFRILPDNVNGYKKNNFKGRVISGKAVTQERTLISNQNKKLPDRFYSIDKRPPVQSKFGVNAPTANRTYNAKCTQRGNELEYAGPGSMYNGSQQQQNQTRTYDRTQCGQTLNAAQEDSGIGGYVTNSYLVSDTDRENNGQQLGPSLTTGQQAYTTNAPGATYRDQTQYNNYDGPVYNSGVLGPETGNYIADPTNRMESVEYSGYAHNPNGNTVSNYVVDPNNRMESVEYGGIAHGNDGMTSYYSSYNADPYHKREDVITAYTPGMGNVNIRDNPENIMQNVEFLNDCNGNTVNYGGTLIPNASTVQNMGIVENTMMIPVENNRNDFGLIEQTLQGNPYVNN